MKRLLLALFLLTASGAWMNAQEKSASAAEDTGDKWIAWKWANFVILAAGLGYLTAKNLPSFFRSRTRAIQAGIAEAQQMKREAEKKAGEMDQRMNALGAEIERFRAQAQSEMEQEGARIGQETVRLIEKQQKQAELEIESAGKAARRELKAYAAELALNLAEQRIRARLNPETEARLVDGFVNDLSRRDLKETASSQGSPN